MEPLVPDSSQNAMETFLNLPLVSSTCSIVSLVYCNIKEHNPCIKSLCEVGETGLKTVTSLAVKCASPIVIKLQPQISGVNQLVCKYLDKTKEAFPVLHQPWVQVVSSPDGVPIRVENMRTMIHLAKDAVMVVKGKAGVVVQVTVGKTKAVLDAGIGSVLCNSIAQLLSAMMHTPLTVREMLESWRSASAQDSGKLPDTSSNKSGPCGQTDTISNKLWRGITHTTGEQCAKTELSTLDNSDGLTNQLQTLCLTIVSSLQGFQQNVQIQVLAVVISASEVYNNFWRAYVCGDLSTNANIAEQQDGHTERPEQPPRVGMADGQRAAAPAFPHCVGKARRFFNLRAGKKAA